MVEVQCGRERGHIEQGQRIRPLAADDGDVRVFLNCHRAGERRHRDAADHLQRVEIEDVGFIAVLAGEHRAIQGGVDRDRFDAETERDGLRDQTRGEIEDRKFVAVRGKVGQALARMYGNDGVGIGRDDLRDFRSRLVVDQANVRFVRHHRHRHAPGGIDGDIANDAIEIHHLRKSARRRGRKIDKNQIVLLVADDRHIEAAIDDQALRLDRQTQRADASIGEFDARKIGVLIADRRGDVVGVVERDIAQGFLHADGGNQTCVRRIELEQFVLVGHGND